MKKLAYIVALFLTAGTGFALTERVVDEKQPLEWILSSRSHNRIAVESGSVEKVFGDSSLFSVNIDPATGNAFIHVLKEIGEDPAALTVVTSTGAVQDLYVRSFEGPSQQLLLKENEESDWVIRPEVSHGATVELLNEILEGDVPQGYGVREWEEGEELFLPEPLSVAKKQVLEGPFETIRIYEIRNPQDRAVVIRPDALKKEGSGWVFVNQLELKAGEKALCLIGIGKE